MVMQKMQAHVNVVLKLQLGGEGRVCYRYLIFWLVLEIVSIKYIK